MDPQFFSCKTETGSAFDRIKTAINAIGTSLAQTEPQTMAELALAIGETEAITLAALHILHSRMEIVRTQTHHWYRHSTAKTGFDPLGTKEQAIYDYINTNAGATLPEIASGTGYNSNLVQHILETLIYNHDLFREQDHLGVMRYATYETAATELTNVKLNAAYNDVVANEGTFLEDCAARLYPALALGAAVAITQRIFRCLQFGKGIIRCP